MKRVWIIGSGAAATVLSLVLIAGLVRVEAPKQPAAEHAPTVTAEVASSDPYGDPRGEPLRLVPAEPDPAHDWLRERSLELVAEYLAGADPESLVGHWHEASTHEAQLIFAAPDSNRFITLSAARADCDRVDAFLNEVGDPLVGVPGLCRRWVSTAQDFLRERGMSGSARNLLREKRVDTSVRVALVYAGWKRTGPGPENFRLVESHALGVYPQSEFGVARRLALDDVMRDLGVGPYTDTPIQLVTALLRW